MPNLIHRIKHVLDWLPILWNDHDWDWVYILDILRFKIKRTRLHLKNYGFACHTKKSLNKMKKCELLLERLTEDQNYFDYETSWKDDKDLKQRIAREEYLRKQDMDLFCNLFSKHYRTWWDVILVCLFCSSWGAC